MLLGENATTAPNKLHMTKGGDYVALRLGGSGYAHDYEEARSEACAICWPCRMVLSTFRT